MFYCHSNFTDPDQVCSIAKNNHDLDYYFFYDQEPLNLSTQTPVFNNVRHARTEDIVYHNRQVYGHLVVSETNSEFLENVVHIYGWKTHYYFYHGWACLDWFRGYNRSYLIPKAVHRQPSRTFMSPNRIIGGQREHRVLFAYHLLKNQINHHYTSCPNVCPVENQPINAIAAKFKTLYPDINDVFDQSNLPWVFNGETTQEMSSCKLTNFREAADSLFYVATETVFFGRRWHLTEKSFKPIALEMPFILVAPAGSLEYLRSYGFKTFADVIDESYDLETDDFLRLEKITKLLKYLDELSFREKQQIHQQCLSIVEHNYNHFYYGKFEQVLWQELQSMMSAWR